jgi:hypothetical protein
MKVEVIGNTEKTVRITTETPFEWEVLKGLLQMTDPIALTKYMQDKGFLTDGDDVVDILDTLEEKMEV